MGNVYVWGINLILFFQSLGDWTIPIMKFFTNLGVEQFYLLVTPILYWCIDTTVGLRTGVMLMLSSSVYNYAKWIFRQPRPYWVSPKVKAHVAESSFGLPSGHAHNSVTIWGIIADSFKKRWLWITAFLLMFFIGLSRMFLGVHFPQDTLLGWTLGAIVLIAFIKLEPVVVRWYKGRRFTQQMAALFLVSMAMILVGALILAPSKEWNIPSIWLENIETAFPGDDPVNPLALSSQVSLGGVFFGLTLGYTFLFKGSGYDPKGSWLQLLIRYLIGVVGIVIFWYGLDAVFPDGESFVPYIFRYLRYFLVGIWVAYLGPVMFIRLKLAKPSGG